ncbi:hypothetical protein ACIBL3_45995 [Kribbella sp. NPDC050124]|uniref:hypothetical protein n=1 Tax=Kribbella sp. NPDC050124 TaxID=3364114 RepID=UPI0037A0FE8C
MLDVRGALVGRVESVGIGRPDGQVSDPWLFDHSLRWPRVVKVRGFRPDGRDLVVEPGQIAYVADDHLRLLVAADDESLSGDPL